MYSINYYLWLESLRARRSKNDSDIDPALRTLRAGAPIHGPRSGVMEVWGRQVAFSPNKLAERKNKPEGMAEIQGLSLFEKQFDIF